MIPNTVRGIGHSLLDWLRFLPWCRHFSQIHRLAEHWSHHHRTSPARLWCGDPTVGGLPPGPKGQRGAGRVWACRREGNCGRLASSGLAQARAPSAGSGARAPRERHPGHRARPDPGPAAKRALGDSAAGEAGQPSEQQRPRARREASSLARERIPAAAANGRRNCGRRRLPIRPVHCVVATHALPPRAAICTETVYRAR